MYSGPIISCVNRIASNKLECYLSQTCIHDITAQYAARVLHFSASSLVKCTFKQDRMLKYYNHIIKVQWLYCIARMFCKVKVSLLKERTIFMGFISFRSFHSISNTGCHFLTS